MTSLLGSFHRIRNFILARIQTGEQCAIRLGVIIGNGCRIYTKNFGSEPFLITIGDRVTISSNVTFINHDGSGWLLNDTRGRRYKYQRITVGDDVFIGANSTILPGVNIGSRVVVGACSVVTKSIPDDVVVAGNPARIIRSYKDFEDQLYQWPSEHDVSCHGAYRDHVMAALVAGYKDELRR